MERAEERIGSLEKEVAELRKFQAEVAGILLKLLDGLRRVDEVNGPSGTDRRVAEAAEEAHLGLSQTEWI